MVMKVVTLQPTDDAKKQTAIKNEKEVVALIIADQQKKKTNLLPNVVTPYMNGPLFNSSKGKSKQIIGHYFMFEYLTGQLTKLKFNKVLSEENCANIIYQVANGLSQLVALNPNFVHRDISLNNIMYVENNNGLIQFKLIDFGTSILDANRNEQNSGITTALINAPEILKQGEKQKFSIVGNKEDVWSLGICLFMLLSQKDKMYGNHVVLSS
jgi:serine/threonine protein kinase